MPAPDQEHRDRARLRLDANVVVEAGAGTGKTTLLTDRLLFLVLGWDKPSPVSVADVVALTFTEKAAGEIKVRLSDRLAEVAAYLSLGGEGTDTARRVVDELERHFGKKGEEVLARARAALEDLDKAQIGTIHSFCAHVLRLFPVEAGVDPGFAVDEGEAFEELFAAEWASWLDEELGERPPRAAAWRALLSRATLDELEALARELCGEKLTLEGLGEPDPAAAAELRAVAERLRRLVDGRPKPKGNSKALERAQEALARLEALAKAAQAREPALGAPAEPPEELKAAWPKAWGEDEAEAAQFEDALALASAASPEDEAVLRLATSLLLPFARRARRAYARRGLVSFDGLLRRARDLVRDRPDVRERLKARFKTLLIDEFQDTDPLQGELLLLLAEEPGGSAKDWRLSVTGPGRLFVVGDPKQSIYRFRGADIAAYQAFTEKLLDEGALACDLTANFRCRPAIVEPVNRVFEAVMRPVPGAQSPYKAIVPAREPAEGAAVALTVVTAGEGKLSAAEVSLTEAAWAARWIAQRPKGLPLSAVAVLLRSSTKLEDLLDAFKRAGIPYAVDLETDFYGAPEVVDLLNLLRVLDDPADRVSLAGLLRSPLGGLTDDQLLSLARADALDYRRDPGPRVLPGPEAARVSALWETLRTLRAAVGRAPLGELVGAALEKTFLPELCAQAYHGQQTVSNLLKLRRLAVEASDRGGTTLAGFVARAAEAASGGRGARARREGESPLADDKLEAVRVLTVHKSKGLEFPVVLLLGLSAKAGGGSAAKPASREDWAAGRRGLRLGRHVSAAMALLERREKALEAHEATRLLYVAMTRAKERLLVAGKDAMEKSALASRLRDAGAWPEDGAPGFLPVEFVKAGSVPETVAPPPPAPPAPGRAKPAPRPPAAGPWTRAAGAGEPDKRLALPEDRPAPGGAELGTLCHRVLQGWDYAGGGDLDEALRAARRGLERRAPGPAWAAAAGEAKRVLAAFLGSPQAKALAGADIVARELPLSRGEDGAAVRGAADLVLREKGRLVVVDFKSEKVEGAAAAAAARERHAAQGAAYTAALEAAWGEKAEFRVLFLRRPEL